MSDPELALRALGRRLEAEPSPDLSALVVARLASAPAQAVVPLRRRRRARILLLAAAVLLVLAAGALAASPGLRDAVFGWLRDSGTPVEQVATLPPAATATAASELGLGTVATAPTPTPGPAAPPTVGALGTPDEVLGGGETVSLVWHARPGLPGGRALPTIGAILTVAPATSGGDPYLLGKLVTPDIAAEFVTLPAAQGGEGVWLSGVPHVLVLADGTRARFRLAANVLAWRVGDRVYRLETNVGRVEAMRIASSVG